MPRVVYSSPLAIAGFLDTISYLYEERKMITHVEMQAIRAFDKLYLVSTEGWAEMEGCDAHWDGGEWSGPAWAENWENEHDRVMSIVAERFGISAVDLALAYEQHHHAELRFFQEYILRQHCGFNPAQEERL